MIVHNKLISISEINTFVQCNYKHHLKYVAKVKGEYSHTLTGGNILHNRIASILEEKRSGIEIDVQKHLLFFDQAMNHKFKDPEFNKDDAIFIGSNFIKKFINKILPDLKPLFIEKVKTNQELNLIGKIDYLDQSGLLIDFKSTFDLPKIEKLHLINNRFFQFYVYMILFQTTRSEVIEFDFTSTLLTRNKINLTPEIEKITKYLLNMYINKILAGENKPTGILNNTCKFCRYKEKCKYYKNWR